MKTQLLTPSIIKAECDKLKAEAEAIMNSGTVTRASDEAWSRKARELVKDK